MYKFDVSSSLSRSISICVLLILLSITTQLPSLGSDFLKPATASGSINGSAYGEFAVSTDGKRLIAENIIKKQIEVIDTQTRSVRSTVSLAHGLNQLTLSRDGGYCAVWDGYNVIVWNTQDWSVASKWPCAVTSKANYDVYIEFLPDDSLLETGDTWGEIYRLESSKYVKYSNCVADFGDTVRKLSPDGRYLACGGYSFLKIWSTRTWRPIICFEGIWRSELGPQDVGFVMFSPKGDLLFAGADNCMHIFNTSGWQKVDNSRTEFFRHGIEFEDGAFSQDGKIFATIGKHLMFWDTRTGRLIANEPGTDCSGVGVEFLPVQHEVVVLTGHLNLIRQPVPSLHS